MGKNKKVKAKEKTIKCSSCGAEDHLLCSTPLQSIKIDLNMAREKINSLREDRDENLIEKGRIEGEIDALEEYLKAMENLSETMLRYSKKGIKK